MLSRVAGLALVMISLEPGTSAAQEIERGASGPNWIYNADERNVFLEGYDLVSYFEREGPVRGQSTIVAEHDDLEFRFATERNRERFLQDPQRFMPACGGWDTYACGANPDLVGFGPNRFRPTPEAFRIIEDQLYLFAQSQRPVINTMARFDGLSEHDQAAALRRLDAFWQDRVHRAAEMGRRPEGMHRQAFLELADWEPLIGSWRCEEWITNNARAVINEGAEKVFQSIGTAEWRFWYGFEGTIIQDHWIPDDNATNSGPATRTWDSANQSWIMHYMPQGTRSDSWWEMTGWWENGELRGEFETQGGQQHGRLRFHQISGDSFKWMSDRSFDAGVTWIDNFQFARCQR